MRESLLKAKVIGCKERGIKLVNRLIKDKFDMVESIIIDSQMENLRTSSCENKILVSRNYPEMVDKIGEEKLKEFLKAGDVIFLVSGANNEFLDSAAKICKGTGILTIGIITNFIDSDRDIKKRDLTSIEKEVDSLIEISDEKLMKILKRNKITSKISDFVDSMIKNIIESIIYNVDTSNKDEAEVLLTAASR